ncbi:MAG: hypothetical protein ACI9SK_001881 [Zhongshania sp.]|jgi:hypothetical protein
MLALMSFGPLVGLAGYAAPGDQYEILGSIMLVPRGGILYLIFQDIEPQIPISKYRASTPSSALVLPCLAWFLSCIRPEFTYHIGIASVTLYQPPFIQRVFMRLLLMITMSVLLCACGVSTYDQSREWRLQECEKVLDDTDRATCKTTTPDYK